MPDYSTNLWMFDWWSPTPGRNSESVYKISFHFRPDKSVSDIFAGKVSLNERLLVICSEPLPQAISKEHWGLKSNCALLLWFFVFIIHAWLNIKIDRRLKASGNGKGKDANKMHIQILQLKVIMKIHIFFRNPKIFSDHLRIRLKCNP